MIEHLFVAVPTDLGSNPAISSHRWVAALAREYRLRRKAGWKLSTAPRTLHVGSGGASALGPEIIELLLVELGLSRPTEELAVEARASTLLPSLIERWVRDGVTRVSIDWPWEGLLFTAAGHLRDAGLSSWGVDVVIGSPRDAAWTGGKMKSRNLLDTILELGPPQISLQEPDEEDGDRFADAYLEWGGRLEGAGYEGWELASFARSDRRPRHFEAVWRGAPYLGLGPGASSFDGKRRLGNLRDGEAYFSRIGRNTDPAESSERPDRAQRVLERVWSGLRLAEGLPFSALPPEARQLQAQWTAQGWAYPDSHRLRLTRRGWLLLDGLAVELAAIGAVDDRSVTRRTSEAR